VADFLFGLGLHNAVILVHHAARRLGVNHGRPHLHDFALNLAKMATAQVHARADVVPSNFPLAVVSIDHLAKLNPSASARSPCDRRAPGCL